MDMWCGDQDAFKPGTWMSVGMGDSFLCRTRQLEIHIRAKVGNSSCYSGELIDNCCFVTTLTGHNASNL